MVTRVNLTTQLFGLIGLVAGLAVLCAVLAAWSSWRLSRLLQDMVDQNLPSLQAAEELEIALLEQRGQVSDYILDAGNRERLQGLGAMKEKYDHWLARAHDTAQTSDAHAILVDLDVVFDKYHARRGDVVALHEEGQRERAIAVLLDEVHPLYLEAFGLCEQFIAANQRFIEARTTEARQHIRWVTWCVGGLAGLTVAAGILLVSLFFTGVVKPLRQVVSEARQFAGHATEGGPETAGDELRAVGVYLRALMSDVAQSQSRLAGAEKLATLGKLAASVAHEIRNPLTAIKMWLFSLQKGAGNDSETRRKFQFISDEIGRLESIVRNFLEFARPPQLKTGTHRLEGLVEKTLDLLRPRLEVKRISADWTPGRELPPVTADPDQFRQVLVNLLNNAAEVTPESGRISMTAAVEQGGDGQPMAVLRMADAGSGMSDEVRDRMFEPFFTTKEDGTGLGLCIAARIMAQHGGRLVLEKTDPAGTTFALWLPVAREEPTP